MKKTLLATTLLACMVGSGFAQGYVLFNNGTTTKISTNSVVGGAATGLTSGPADSYYYALLVSPTASTVSGAYAIDDSNWTLATGALGDVYGASTATAGRFNTTVADAANSEATDISSGAPQHFVVLGWSANIGTTLSDLEAYLADPTFAGFVGESAVSGLITPGTGGLSTPPGLFGTGAGLINSFTLGLVQPVPEPTTMALAGLGGLALLAFRRKK